MDDSSEAHLRRKRLPSRLIYLIFLITEFFEEFSEHYLGNLKLLANCMYFFRVNLVDVITSFCGHLPQIVVVLVNRVLSDGSVNCQYGWALNCFAQ